MGSLPAPHLCPAGSASSCGSPAPGLWPTGGDLPGCTILVPSCLHPPPVTASAPSHCGQCCGMPGMATAQPAGAAGAAGLSPDGAGTADDTVWPLPTLKACKFTAKPLAQRPPPPANKQAHAGWAGRQVSITGGVEGGCVSDTNQLINHSDPAVKMRGQSKAAGKLPGTPANPTTHCLVRWDWPPPLTWPIPAFPYTSLSRGVMAACWEKPG